MCLNEIKIHSVVLEYEGHLLTKKEHKEKLKDYKKRGIDGSYIFEVSTSLYVSKAGKIFSYSLS